MEQVIIHVENPPHVSVTPTSTAICLDGTTTLTASGANTYTWTPLTGLGVATSSVVLAYPTSTTVYTVTGSTAPTCGNSSATATVTVNPIPPSPIVSGHCSNHYKLYKLSSE